MKRLLRTFLVAFFILGLAACGSSGSSDSTDSPSLTTIDSLPKATGAMSSSSDSSYRILRDFLIRPAYAAAATGMNLNDTTSDSFSSSSSLAGCNSFNMVKEAINSAAQADQILCYVDQISEQFSDQGIDVYDGEWHVFDMDITGQEGSPDRIKMQVVKNAAGSITSFEMFMCADASGTSIQNEYTKQTISGTSLEMVAKGTHTNADGSGSGSHYVVVDGVLDSSGRYSSKTITTQYTGTYNESPNWSEATVIQTPGRFTLTAYQSGQWSQGEQSGSYSDQTAARGEILDANTSFSSTGYDIRLLAVGDGASKFINSGSSDQWGSYRYPESGSAVEAWLGDDDATLDPATDSDFYSEADALTLPEVEGVFSISFTEGTEDWDCVTLPDGVTAEDLGTIDGAAMDAACTKYGLNHNWIDCYTQIQPSE